jgi:hypothetical protein
VKFTPVPTFFVPLWAGARGIPLRRFVLLDMFINLLWALSFLVTGYAIEREILTVHEDSAWIFWAANNGFLCSTFEELLETASIARGSATASQSVWDKVRSGV